MCRLQGIVPSTCLVGVFIHGVDFEKNPRAEHIPNCPVCAANVLLFLNENSNNNNNSTDLLP